MAADTTSGEKPRSQASILPEIDGARRLLRLAELGEELGAKSVAEESRALAARVTEGRFYVACLGQFKRGKSTLINALVGENLVPVGFVPVTTVPTVIRYGKTMKARVQFQDSSWREVARSELAQYISEEQNPENAKGVRGAEVYCPNGLLSGGICLVDTPGLGSVWKANTAATQAFIPHIDAALVVVGADPPLAGEELAMVEAVGRQVSNLIVVLNKADRTTDAERAAAAGFTHELLEKRLGRAVGPILEISAAERLQNRGPERDWGKLVSALEQLVRESGRQLIHAAYERGILRLGEQMLAIVAEERGALERPIEESERRIALIKKTIAGADRSIREMEFLWMAEQRHLSDLFVSRHKAFIASQSPTIEGEFDRDVQNTRELLGPAYRRKTMGVAQKVVERHVVPWLKVEQQEGEAQYRRAAGRFVEMANQFLADLAQAGVPELARLPHALDPETGFRKRSEFQFRDLISIASPASPVRWLADVFLAFIGLRSVIRKEAREFLEQILETNCSRVQNDVLNRIQESRSRLEVEVRRVLREISRVAEEALAHACDACAAGPAGMAAALTRLGDLEREVRGLLPL